MTLLKLLIKLYQNYSLSLKNNVGLSIDSEKLDQIAEIIQSFYFYDVRKNSSKIKDVSPKLTFKLNDGLSINIQLVNFKNKEEAWVKIYANSTNMKSKLKSEEINKRTKTYDFLANINTSEVFNWKIRDLIKAK